MAIEVFNRYEHKYMLDEDTFEKVIAVMDTHMDLDSHSAGHIPYTIANIYFDTRDNYLIRRSLEKPIYKEKLRLRSYGVPDENDKVFLEIKKKYNGIVNKRRTALTLSEAYNFVKTGQSPPPKKYMNLQVINELTYLMDCYDLSPKVYLAYDRIAYFESGNPDLRISFDTNIRSRRYDLSLENGDFGEMLLDGEYYLMEIKTALAKPLWLSNMLSELDIKRQSFSKYGTEFKHFINNKKYDDMKGEYYGKHKQLI